MCCNRLENGFVNAIAVYPYDNTYNIAWQTYSEEDVRNRKAYLRDDLHSFIAPADVIGFLQSIGYPATEFEVIVGYLKKDDHSAT